MIKVIVHGALGRMGKEVTRFVTESEDMALAALVDINGDGAEVLTSLDAFAGEADVIIDFSHHAAVPAVLAYAKKRGIPAIIATTGCTEEENAAIRETAESLPVFASGNMSIGVAVLAAFAAEAARIMKDADIEIVETHHKNKLDAPSGTALLIANEIKTNRPQANFVLGRSGMKKREKDDIGINAIRCGNIVGIHEVIISTESQTITLKHEAHTRALFAEGAVAAARFICGKEAGLYNIKDMVRK
ncbi:MAG: 4-hydroxy-tetrahydrodipicolinate reductase [Clostridia bacterium]|nr:4-hydroxy-tetrahydrodipicolinate reductase [Clostridia bacterium]